MVSVKLKETLHRYAIALQQFKQVCALAKKQTGYGRIHCRQAGKRALCNAQP